MGKRSSPVVKSVARAANVLVSLCNGPARLTDISNRLNLSRATAYRMLKTLEASGLVIQDPVSNRYCLGYWIINIASDPLLAHQVLVTCIREEMEYLRELSGETVALHIRVGDLRFCLEEFESSQSLKFVSGKGLVAPLYIGSAGKVLLAALQEDELEMLLKNIELVPLTSHTMVDKGVLMEEVSKTRSQGYATSHAERVPGASAISIPIDNYVCPVALSVLGPAGRFTVKEMMSILGEMRKSASRVSKKMPQSIKKETRIKAGVTEETKALELSAFKSPV